jgi:hypothetical protein
MAKSGPLFMSFGPMFMSFPKRIMILTERIMISAEMFMIPVPGIMSFSAKLINISQMFMISLLRIMNILLPPTFRKERARGASLARSTEGRFDRTWAGAEVTGPPMAVQMHGCGRPRSPYLRIPSSSCFISRAARPTADFQSSPAAACG